MACDIHWHLNLEIQTQIKFWCIAYIKSRIMKLGSTWAKKVKGNMCMYLWRTFCGMEILAFFWNLLFNVALCGQNTDVRARVWITVWYLQISLSLDPSRSTFFASDLQQMPAWGKLSPPSWLQTLRCSFLYSGTQTLVPQRDRCLNVNGDCMEVLCVPSTADEMYGCGCQNKLIVIRVICYHILWIFLVTTNCCSCCGHYEPLWNESA
jgi:hypothetical protein